MMTGLFALFLAVPRLMEGRETEMMMDENNGWGVIAVMVALYEAVYRVVFTICLAVFVIAVGGGGDEGEGAAHADVAKRIGTDDDDTNVIVDIDRHGNKKIISASSSASCNKYKTEAVTGSKLASGWKTVLSNRAVKRLAPLSYAVYLMHPFAVSLAARAWPRIDAQERADLWRFLPGGLLVYAASVAIAVPCHWAERKFHRMRLAAGARVGMIFRAARGLQEGVEPDVNGGKKTK